MIRPRDAHGHFINRQSWELAYALAGERVPKRVGARNATAPLPMSEIERLARKRTHAAPVPTPKPPRRKPREKKLAPRPEQSAFPSGTEFELTARYKAQTRGARATLHLKIRVTLTAPMTDVQARSLLDRAVRSGSVPPGIEVSAIDWARGKKDGGYDDPSGSELRAFYGPIIGAGATRFAKVADSERDL
jgi:hypothetical protein